MKRPAQEKKILTSSAKLAEMFCFYDHVVEKDLVRSGKEVVQVLEPRSRFHAYTKKNSLCVSLIQDAILAISLGEKEIFTHEFVIRESASGKLTKSVVPRLKSTESPSFLLRIRLHESALKKPELVTTKTQDAIYALVHYWSECLKSAYKRT